MDMVELPNRASLLISTFSSSGSSRVRKLKGLCPSWGMEAWQDLPVMVSTAQKRPREPMAMSFSVASPTTA